MPRCQRKPDGADEERERNPGGGLIGKREIGDDAAREQHRKPKEPTVLLPFEHVGRQPERGRKQPLPARAISTVPFLVAPLRHGRCLQPGRSASALPLPRIRPYATSRPR
jgi:hypothetical protein